MQRTTTDREILARLDSDIAEVIDMAGLPQARAANCNKFYRPRKAALKYIPKPALALFKLIVKRILEETVASLRLDPSSDLSKSCIMAFQSVMGIFSLGRPSGQDALMHMLRDILHEESAVLAVLQKVLHCNLPNLPSATVPTLEPHEPTAVDSIPIKVARKVVNLVHSNRCGAALSKLESFVKNEAPVSILQNSVLDSLRALHPPASDQDQLRDVPASVSCLQVQAEQVLLILSKLPKDSSPGLSTWTFEMIQSLLHESDDILQLVIKLFNLILEGNGGSSPLWNACLLIPITKGKGGIRPIAVADTWMRFLARVVARGYSDAARDALSPLQVGVGVSAGAEHIVHICKSKAHQIVSSQDSTDVIIQIDGKNAFNSIRRRFILDRILAEPKFASLARFLKWSYGEASPLYDENGVWVFDSASGVRQGDPLGPLLFSLGLHGVLESLVRKHPEVAIYGYLDDLTLTGEATKVISAYKYLKGLLLAVGIVVNGSKSQGFCSPDMVEPLRVALGEVPISSEGISVLGCPIGSDEYVSSEVSKILGKYSAILPLVLQFPGKVAYQLLEHCICKRPTYLLRSVCPWLIHNPASLFDMRISKAINSFIVQQDTPLNTPPSSLAELDALPSLIDRADVVRSLPRTMGGLGIRKAADLRSPAWISSFISSWSWISQKIPALMGAPCASLLSDPTFQSHFSDSFEATMGSRIESAVQLVDYYSKHGKIPTQRFLTQLLVDEPNHKSLLAIISPLESTLAYHLSETDEQSGLWLSAGLSQSPVLSMSDAVFIENVGLRLLINPLDVDPSVSLRCPCDSTRFLETELDNYHCFSCTGKNGPSGVSHHRHGDVTNCLADFVLEACPNAQVIKEATMPLVAKQLRADVRLDQGHITCFFDVSVVNPAARSYITAVQSHVTPLAAATLMEKKKVIKYKASYNALNGYKEIGDNVIPFVLESTGAYGTSALDVITKLAGFKNLVPTPNDRLAKARRFFMRRVAVILAKSRYDLLCHFRRRVIRTDFNVRINSLDFSPSVEGSDSSHSDWEEPVLS